jgi:hypothetical protein
MAGRQAVETFFNWDRVAQAMRDIGCRAALRSRAGEGSAE